MSRCRAQREIDQLVCRQCGLAWDANDPDPPACRESPPAAPGTARTPALSDRQQRRARALRHLDAIIAELQAGE